MTRFPEAIKAFTKIVTAYHRGELFKMNFAITYKCNSRCKMCNIWRRYIENPQMIKDELEINEIRQIFKGFGKLVWVSLTGGEPFLREDIIDIVQSARNICQIKMINITTNGFNSKLVEDKVRGVAEVAVPLTFVNVSLDGPSETHDYLRGTNGAYDNALKTLWLLHMLSKKYSNLSIGFEYTITPFNAGQLKLLVDKLKKAELGWLLENSTITMCHQGNLYNNLNSNSISQFDDNSFKSKALEDLDDSFHLTRAISPLTLVKKKYLKSARNYLLNGRVQLRCVALQNSLFLDPYGNIFPCIILEHKIGNLRDYQYDIHKLLKSEEALKTRLEVDVCKKCWTPCEAYPSIMTHLTSLIKVYE
jgi:MoaA/NifB/PqqE/SkfB family radical SAM enzyme